MGSRILLVFIYMLYAWSYYTYVYKFVYLNVRPLTTQIAYLVVFHILYIIVVTLYILTVRDRGWVVPTKYKLPLNLYEKLLKAYKHEEDDIIADFCQNQNIIVHQRTKDGLKRICYICKHIKPDRTYHCSKCKVCVRRLDHHCYFTNNCIGLTNLRYFILLIVYTAIWTIFCASTGIDHIVRVIISVQPVTARESYLIVSAIIATNMGIIMSIVAITNLLLISKNMAVIETRYKPRFEDGTRKCYNMNCWSNWVQVCGRKFYLWFLPCNFVKYNDYYEPQPLKHPTEK